jgi:regulator of sigma D
MPSPDDVIQDRRAGSHRMIEQLVQERTQMLSLYSDLAAQHPFNDSDSVTDLLEQFCQALIDYTADAHFRLYRYLDEKKERRRSVVELADSIYPGIMATTETILEFNDKYDSESRAAIPLKALERDLSQLGEKLADRIDLEDRVIEVLSRGARN